MMQTLRVRKQNNIQAQAGFTLFELVVVISIMSVLLGLAVPALNVGPGKGDFSDFKTILKSGAVEARYLAMITGKVQTLSFENEGEVFVLHSDFYRADLPKAYQIMSIQTAGGERENNFNIRFYPSGLVESCVLHVRRDHQDYSFYLPPISGIKGGQGQINFESFQE